MHSQDAARLPLEVAIQTHQGNVREVNEDNALVEWWPDGSALLAVVADGMGGHSGGEVASHIAVEVFREMLLQPLPSERKETYEALLERFYAADVAIRDRADLSLIGMGATLVAAIVRRSEFVHLYAGDCRLYHFGPGDQMYVTADHSVIQVLLDTGHIKHDEVAQHPMRSVVTSCLGGGVEGKLSVEPKWDNDSAGGPAFRRLSTGDVMLLSSDGFHGQVADSVPAQLVVEAGTHAQRLAEEVIRVALEAGGNDNITAIAIKWTGEPQDWRDEDSLFSTGELISTATEPSSEPGALAEVAGSNVAPGESVENLVEGTENGKQPETAVASKSDSDTSIQSESFLGKLLHWRRGRK